MVFPHWRFVIAASVTAFCYPFQMAYHAGVINVPGNLFLQFINETNIRRYGSPMSSTAIDVLWGWIVSIHSIGGILGALLTPSIVEKFGLKTTLMILSNIIAISASLIMSFFQTAHSYEMLAVGRFLAGFSSGIATTLGPVYLCECSSVEYRGFMGGLKNVFYNFQTVLAFVIALPAVWGNISSLPLLLGLGIIPGLIQIISSFFLKESPKFLYIKRDDAVAAEKSLRFWSPSPDSIPLDTKAIFQEFDQEAKVLSQTVGFFQAMKIPYFRQALVISVLILACQACTGIYAVFSYSTDMFVKLGFDQHSAGICTNMLAVVNTVGSIVVAPFLQKFARRTFYFVGYFLLVLCLLMYTACSILYEKYEWPWTAYVALLFLFFYCIVYDMGAGSLTWIIPAEISPQAIRSTVMSVASAAGWLLALIFTFIFPPMMSKLGPWSFFVFIVPLVAGLAYLYKFMPETGQKTFGELVNGSSIALEKSDSKTRKVTLGVTNPLTNL